MIVDAYGSPYAALPTTTEQWWSEKAPAGTLCPGCKRELLCRWRCGWHGCGWSAAVPEAMPAPHCDSKYRCRLGMPHRMCACCCAGCHRATCASGCEKCTFAPQPKLGDLTPDEDTKIVCVLTYDVDEPSDAHGVEHLRVLVATNVEELAREWRWNRQGQLDLESSAAFEAWLVAEGYARRTDDVEVIDP